jgi:hypothetical protein
MAGLRIESAIDMHCHFGPDTIGTPNAHPMHSVTGLEAAQEAHKSGHRAIVLKSHSFATVQLAAEIEQAVPGIRVIGGICTDYPSGGLNSWAVFSALQLGARIVWLPTVHSHQDYLNGKAEVMGTIGIGIRVTGDDGNPTPEVREIFDLVKQFDAVLATGHVTAAEHYSVIKAFAREGKLLVTHAGELLAGPHLSPEQCRELAELGATIELTAQCCDCVFGHQGMSIDEMIAMIRTIGHERCTLSTDYGWNAALPRPAPGMQDFLERLWAHGVSEQELTRMVVQNPAELLAL